MNISNTKLKVIFMGSSHFSVPSLNELFNSKNINVTAVFTQPDKPFGRKQELKATPVKQFAVKNDLNLFQPKNKKELNKMLEGLECDFFVVIAYGMILDKKVLEKPKISALNIHASILPKYRGASPIHAAILNGDKETGISYMKMDDKLDHGPVYKTINIKIEDKDLTKLSIELSKLGAKNLINILQKISSSEIQAKTQNPAQASFTKKIEKEEGKVNFKIDSAEKILRMLKAFTPWPGVYFKTLGKKIKIHQAKLANKNLPAGKLFKIDKKLYLGCIDKSLKLEKIQLEGKAKQSATDFLNGYNHLFELNK